MNTPMNMPELYTIEALRERLALLRKSPTHKSSSTTPTSLYVFLTIFNKAQRACSLNYNEGTKALIDWLSPIDFGLDTLDTASIPHILYSYEVNELCQLLAPLDDSVKSIDAVLSLQSKIAKAIIHTAYSKIGGF